MTKDDAEGTTETAAWRFWIVNCTVIFKPFQSWVPLAISSPTFLGDWNQGDNWFKECPNDAVHMQLLTRPNGPILGAKDEVAPISPPTARR